MITVRALRVLLCCAMIVPLVGGVAPGVAAPPPRPLCDACGEQFERTAADHGVALTVERSTATVTVHENESATWTVRNRLADAETAARLRANETLRTRIADGAMWDVDFLGSSVSEAGVLAMRYREPEFATESVGGALRSGAFTETHGYRNLDGLGADRLTVVAPDGMRVGWSAPGASVSEDGRRTTLESLDGHGFVTFVPAGSALGPVLSLIAVASAVGPATALTVALGVGLPVAAFGLVVGAAGRLLSRIGRDFERVRDRAGVTLAVGGALVATLPLLATGGVSLLGGAAAPAFGAGLACVVLGGALSRPAIRERVTYRALVVGAGFGVLLAAASTLAAALAFDQNGLTRSFLSSARFLVPVFAFLPAGYAFGRGDEALALGTAAVGFALALVPAAPFASTGLRFGPLGLLVLIAYTIAVTVVGTPLLVAGASLAAPGAADTTGTDPSGE